MTELVRKLHPRQVILLAAGLCLLTGQALLLLCVPLRLAEAMALSAAADLLLAVALLGAGTAACAAFASGFGSLLREQLMVCLLQLDADRMTRLQTADPGRRLVQDVTRVQRLLCVLLQTLAPAPILAIGAISSLRSAALRQNLPAACCLAGCLLLALALTVRAFWAYGAAKPALRRVRQLLHLHPQIRYGDRTAGPEYGTIEFCHVSFRYPGAEENALTDVSFRLGRGEALGLIGPSGSGKTTIFLLITRFYDPTEGKILLDGRDIREYDRKSLYDRLGYVPQKPFLFEGTVEENVQFGQSDAVISPEHTWLALSQARANDFVERLPGRLQEPLTKAVIPPAEKQKLLIARALARNPELLLCDCASAGLDGESAARLRAGLADDLVGVTKILAGSCGAVQQAETLLVLNRGRIVGRGSHQELLRTCPFYQALAGVKCS